jgi:hypothetical protein
MEIQLLDSFQQWLESLGLRNWSFDINHHSNDNSRDSLIFEMLNHLENQGSHNPTTSR